MRFLGCSGRESPETTRSSPDSEAPGRGREPERRPRSDGATRRHKQRSRVTRSLFVYFTGIPRFLAAGLPGRFEELCTVLLKAQGHTGVRRWRTGADGGVDILSRDPDGRRWVTQCNKPSQRSPNALLGGG